MLFHIRVNRKSWVKQPLFFIGMLKKEGVFENTHNILHSILCILSQKPKNHLFLDFADVSWHQFPEFALGFLNLRSLDVFAMNYCIEYIECI